MPPIAPWTAPCLVTTEPVLDPDTVRVGTAEAEVSLIQTRRLEPDSIGARTASVSVFAVTVVDEVSSSSAGHAIVAATCSDPLQIVTPRSTGNGVLTGVTDDHITTTTAEESIVTRLPEHSIVALPSPNLVVPSAAVQAVIAPETAADDVAASEAPQSVLTA